MFGYNLRPTFTKMHNKLPKHLHLKTFDKEHNKPLQLNCSLYNFYLFIILHYNVAIVKFATCDVKFVTTSCKLAN